MEDLFTQREPLYLACADLIVDTGVMQSKAVVTQILEQFRLADR
jgi:shikimate kinase